MRLRNLFESQEDPTKKVKDLFNVQRDIEVKDQSNVQSDIEVKDQSNVQGDIEVKDQIVNVKGSLIIKENKKIPLLPFTLGTVTGSVFMENAGLKNCQGFPTWVGGEFSVAYNPELVNLQGCEKLECQVFVAHDTGLQSLKNCPLATYYDFDYTPITSLDGLRVEKLLKLKARNQNLVNIRAILAKQNRDLSNSSIRLNYNRNLPLVYLTVMADKGPDGFFNIEINNLDSTVEQTIKPYRGKGLGAAIECAIALRDQGFAGNAKLR